MNNSLMQRVTSTKTSREKTRVKFPGIVRVARERGVTRQHLYLVLCGHRSSPSLKQAYEQRRNQ